jgi:hypothetical protein
MSILKKVSKLNAIQLAFALSLSSLVACSDTHMTGGGAAVQTCKDTAKVKCLKPSPEEPLLEPELGEGSGNLLITSGFEVSPALIVRKANCLMCHSKVTGDVISDFNIHLSPLNARASAAAGKHITQAVFEAPDGIRPRNWNTASINGKLIIPQQEIPDSLLSSFAGATAGFTLEKALTTTMLGFDPGEVAASLNGMKSLNNIGPSRDRTKPGVDAVIAAKTLKIDPPVESEITALLSDPDAKPASMSADNFKIMTIGVDSSISGIVVKNGAVANAPYAINNGPITCKGDVVIGGTLVLKDVGTMNLADKSCRLYVSKVVFIKGSLKAGGDPKLGIQIAAGHGVIAGVKYARSASGLINEERNNVAAEIEDVRPAYYMVKLKPDGSVDRKFATSNYDTSTIPVATDFAKVKGPHWNFLSSERPAVDGCRYDGLSLNPTVVACAVLPISEALADYSLSAYRADLDGVLIATQTFFSRYFGMVKGVVVADFALGSLDRLDFTADPRFDKVPVLPRLKRSLITIEK